VAQQEIGRGEESYKSGHTDRQRGGIRNKFSPSPQRDDASDTAGYAGAQPDYGTLRSSDACWTRPTGGRRLGA
jgi:hypothetical protein